MNVPFSECCTWAGVLGAILSVATGCLAMMVQPRRPGAPLPAGDHDPDLREFAPWFVCTGAFAASAAALAPLAELPAVTLALLLFSPVFGTMVFMIESALEAAIRHGSAKDRSA